MHTDIESPVEVASQKALCKLMMHLFSALRQSTMYRFPHGYRIPMAKTSLADGSNQTASRMHEAGGNNAGCSEIPKSRRALQYSAEENVRRIPGRLQGAP